MAVAAIGSVALPRPSSASGPQVRLSNGLVADLSPRAGAAKDRLEQQLLQRERELRLERSVRKMPDLTQTSEELLVPGGGSSYCGPVAVSNAIMGLAAAGQPDLLPQRPSPRQAHTALVRLLGSGRYMGTSANAGTGAAGLMVGLERYLRHQGYRPSLSYQGWRGHPRRFATGQKAPSRDAMIDAFAQGASVFVNIGWYRPSPRVEGVFRRRGGHWLTLVGTGVDATGDASPHTLVFHDPAPWAGPEGERHFARFEALGEGWLITEVGAFASEGHHILSGVHVKHPGDVAIVDGVVTLVIGATRKAATPG